MSDAVARREKMGVKEELWRGSWLTVKRADELALHVGQRDAMCEKCASKEEPR